MSQQWADYRVFWRQFRQAHYSTGAVLPSGNALCAALTHFVRKRPTPSPAVRNGFATPSKPKPFARRILEVGPGTGAVTAHIIRHMRPSDRLVLVEYNEQFVSYLRNRLNEFPGFDDARDRVQLVHSSVEVLPENEGYDLIISGLPLNNFPVDFVERILIKLQRLLERDGTLSFFEYIAIRRAKSLVSSKQERERLRGLGRTLRSLLKENEIRRDLVWANVPPAWVHHVCFGKSDKSSK